MAKFCCVITDVESIWNVVFLFMIVSWELFLLIFNTQEHIIVCWNTQESPLFSWDSAQTKFIGLYSSTQIAHRFQFRTCNFPRAAEFLLKSMSCTVLSFPLYVCITRAPPSLLHFYFLEFSLCYFGVNKCLCWVREMEVTKKTLLCIIVLSAAWHKTAGREILSKPEIKDVDIHVPELHAIYFCFV